jgi:hypothetical protein
MEGRKVIDDVERSGRRSTVGDGRVQGGKRHFKISELSCEFPQIACTVLYDIMKVRLGYHKFRTRLDPKMLTDEHETHRMASALIFLEGYHEDGDEFLNRIIRVTSYET